MANILADRIRFAGANTGSSKTRQTVTQQQQAQKKAKTVAQKQQQQRTPTYNVPTTSYNNMGMYQTFGATPQQQQQPLPTSVPTTPYNYQQPYNTSGVSPQVQPVGYTPTDYTNYIPPIPYHSPTPGSWYQPGVGTYAVQQPGTPSRKTRVGLLQQQAERTRAARSAGGYQPSGGWYSPFRGQGYGPFTYASQTVASIPDNSGSGYYDYGGGGYYYGGGGTYPSYSASSGSWYNRLVNWNIGK